MGLFEEQRRRGPIGEAAANLQTLLIVIIVLSMVSIAWFAFGGGFVSAILFPLFTGLICALGFYGAQRENDGMLLLFIVFQGLKVLGTVVVTIIYIWIVAQIEGNPDFDYAGSRETLRTAAIISIVYYLINAVVLIISVIWAQRLRTLIKNHHLAAPHGGYYQQQQYA